MKKQAPTKKTVYVAFNGTIAASFPSAFKKLGYDVLENLDGVIPEVGIVWNDLRMTTDEQKEIMKVLHKGSNMFILEHGFFKRKDNFQLDKHGFLHKANWVNLVNTPASERGFEKLKEFLPSGCARMHTSTQGKILVVGQNDGDTQLVDSEVRHSTVFRNLVASCLPKGSNACFRPHPRTDKKYSSNNLLPTQEIDIIERLHYRKAKEAVNITDVLRDVKYIITINSNLIVDALTMGIPALAFGPHTGINARVVKHATVANLREKIMEMEQGWRPKQSKVDNYLAWLASVQWNLAELGEANNWREWLKPKEMYT